MGCGSEVASFAYCTSFVLIVSYAMLNLFVAVVLEQFSEVCNAVSSSGRLFVINFTLSAPVK